MKSRLEQSLVTHETILRRFNAIPGGWQARSMFTDWCECMSLSISNAVPEPMRDEAWRAREDRYLQIAGKHGGEVMQAFAELYGMLVLAMEHSVSRGVNHGPDDVLGRVFEGLDLGNDRAGQFFTPMEVCRAMAKMSMHDLDTVIGDKPYITVCEPSSGAGRTVMAAAEVLREGGRDPAARMVATLIDIDSLCCWMSHINMTLCGIPAVIVHGDALTCQEWGRYHSTTWWLGSWRQSTTDNPLAKAMAAIRELLEEQPANDNQPTEPKATAAGQFLLL